MRLNDGNNRIRGEREALRQDNKKLRSTIAELRKDTHREKVRNDAMIDRLLGQLQAAEDKLRQPQGQPQSRLPSHQEMGVIDPACLQLKDVLLSLLHPEVCRDPLPCRPM